MSGTQGAVSAVAPSSRPALTRRWAFHLTILVVLIAAFVTSFKGGSHGAYVLGFPPEFLFTAPLICDIVAGLATLVHGWARDDDEMRTWATTFVMIPMLLSWMANAVDHLGRAQPDPAWPAAGQWAWIASVILFAGLCPVSVASLLFFATKFREFERRSAGPDVAVKSEITATPDETVAVSGNVTPVDEPEFVEPTPRIPVLSAPKPVAIETEVDAETVKEIDEIETSSKAVSPPAPPRRLTAVSSPAPPWGERARELKRKGVKHATAYRQAKREWREENEASA